MEFDHDIRETKRLLCGSIVGASKSQQAAAASIFQKFLDRCELIIAVMTNEKLLTLPPELSAKVKNHRGNTDALFAELHAMPFDSFLIVMDSLLLLTITYPPSIKKGD